MAWDWIRNKKLPEYMVLQDCCYWLLHPTFSCLSWGRIPTTYPYFNIKRDLTGMRIHIIKIRRKLHHLFLTYWGRMTHICVSKLTIIGSDNRLSPGRRQAIIWTNSRILLIGPLGTNTGEILIEIYIFLFKKIHLKRSSGKGDLNVLMIFIYW